MAAFGLCGSVGIQAAAGGGCDGADWQGGGI